MQDTDPIDGVYIGLMSGTSLDAVDGALVRFQRGEPETLGFASTPIAPDLRSDLLTLQSPSHDEIDRAARAAIALTRCYADVTMALTRDVGGRPDVRAIGAHGQTIRHRPEAGYTLQLIDGALLSELTGLPVVCDFRSADIAAGGQGAPLVPAFHAHAFASPLRRRVIVNIGGIANVSLIGPGTGVRGFDTGPGNVLLDLWNETHRGTPYDRDGAWGAAGSVIPELLEAMLAEPYFTKPPPKSTGRDLFNPAWLEGMLSKLRVAPRPVDVQSTLLALTAESIGNACRAFSADEVFVCGGGAANAALMHALQIACTPARVASTDRLGAPPQSVEAVAFAWLAARRLAGLPGNLPAVTGARGSRILGALYAAARGTE